MNANEIPARRLVNASILVETTTDWGRTYLERVGGAWGRPEDAIKAAAARKANESPRGYRIVGVAIKDVQTGEQWAVAV